MCVAAQKSENTWLTCYVGGNTHNPWLETVQQINETFTLLKQNRENCKCPLFMINISPQLMGDQMRSSLLKGSNAEHAKRLNHWFPKSHDGVGVTRSIQTGKSD